MAENTRIIRKLMPSTEECPEFVYENPLLDKDVAKTLAKSFIKILKISSEHVPSNNSLRETILENIRKMCTGQPEDHAKADDDVTELLTGLYQMHIGESVSSAAKDLDKQLDAFLVRKLKNCDIEPKFDMMLHSDTVQALINLNKHGIFMDILAKDVIHWDAGLPKNMKVLKSLLGEEHFLSEELTGDICIKMKPEIEMTLLDFCYDILTYRGQNVVNIMTGNTKLKKLIENCSKSPECFQMCCGILNFIFIMTNYDSEMQAFIPEFVKAVKLLCDPKMSVTLYAYHLTCQATLLDFDVNSLPEQIRDYYVEQTVIHLSKLHEMCENDLIMLLSHYPQWLDIYMSDEKQKETSYSL